MKRTKITPPQLASRWGIGDEKVLAWIHSGELRAIDASTKRGGRPRYLIDEVDIAAFEAKRAVTQPPKQRRSRRRAPTEVVEFLLRTELAMLENKQPDDSGQQEAANPVERFPKSPTNP